MGRSVRLLLAATATIAGLPKIASEQLIEFPEAPRAEAEALLEATADYLAVAYEARRSIHSPQPCVGLKAESEAEMLYLAAAKGVATRANAIPSALMAPDVRIEHSLDRLDGNSLLAQALASGSALGEFHEHIRLFERAFGTSGTRLVAPMSTFLAGNGLGYTSTEVRQIVLDTRNRSTHADRPEKGLAMERDVQRIVFRSRQAAYDVLFNKETWNDSSPQRRSLWKPKVGLASPDRPFLDQGAEASIRFQLLDEFNVFQLDLKHGQVIPEEWWQDRRRETLLASGPIEIREA